MSPDDVEHLARNLREHPSIRSKLAIGKAAGMLGIDAQSAGQPGDDAAVLPREDGTFDLLAGEGFIPGFVNSDPWFAGWCGIMVNLSDIAAMGGRAVGVIDQVWAPDAEAAQPLMAGLRDASAAYGVAVLGGHTNFAAAECNLAVSVLGRANALISSFTARPGDQLIMAVDLLGDYRNFDNFFAARSRSSDHLRAGLNILPTLAEKGLVRAGKDISQGGVVGTALMLAECSGVGIDIALDRLAPPAGAGLERWLRSFPSFGFLLSVAPGQADAVCQHFRRHDIWAAPIGDVVPGSAVRLCAEDAKSLFWDHAAAPYLNVTARSVQYA